MWIKIEARCKVDELCDPMVPSFTQSTSNHGFLQLALDFTENSAKLDAPRNNSLSNLCCFSSNLVLKKPDLSSCWLIVVLDIW